MSFLEKVNTLNKELDKINSYKEYKQKIIDFFNEFDFPIIDKYDYRYNVYFMYYVLMVISRKNIPLHGEVYACCYFPEIYFMLSIGLTKKAWENKQKIIREILIKLFGENSTNPIFLKLISYLDTDLSKSLNDKSSLAEFNYLYGLKIDKNYVDFPINDISKEYNYIMINATYNLLKLDSIIMYKDIPKMATKLLDEKTVNDYLPYDSYEITPAKEPYYSIDNHKEITKIGIDYNNGFCSIFLEEFDNQEKDNFLNGKIYGSISPLIFEMKLAKEWYSQQSSDKKSLEEVNDINKTIKNIIHKNFDIKSIKKTMKNLVKNLSKYLLDEKEIVYFEKYIYNAINLDELNERILYDYVKEYFS